ncbi:S-adenosyl-L-methionine-dependent methyltransferase [Rhizophagus clarus]|uniref:S-adenosyl-L-methionine-dependent methyltransferase n=1 Tax=Rhizophagus clarus TaxID=94130 RepID=A0A8H3MCU1_9GLOM|nr:S-adenosyl-L-methionine-dependent methyltransferase [Rhizophagus clarus]
MGNILSARKKKNFSKHDIGNKKIEKEPLKYFLPNFVKDTDIMVILHFLGCYLFQSIQSAPIENRLASGCKVLDVGCGPGTWLLDLAAVYNSSSFFGIDLVPIFPKEIKPHNVEFRQGDVLDTLPYDDNTFDYVHQGNMLSVFTFDEWHFVIRELIRVCKPGGYIEFTEPELATETGPILSKFYESLIVLSESRNVKIRISRTKKGGNAGQAYMDVHDGYFLNDPMPETLCEFMGLTREEYFKLFKEAKKEVNERFAPNCDIYRVWCQKIQGSHTN